MVVTFVFMIFECAPLAAVSLSLRNNFVILQTDIPQFLC